MSDNRQLAQANQANDDTDLQKVITDRLSASESSADIVLWTQVRGEVLRQNAEAEDRRHRRQIEKLQMYGKISISIVAMLVGVLLLKMGFVTPGFFALGAGLFWLAPDFVKAYLDKFMPKE